MGSPWDQGCELEHVLPFSISTRKEERKWSRGEDQLGQQKKGYSVYPLSIEYFILLNMNIIFCTDRENDNEIIEKQRNPPEETILEKEHSWIIRSSVKWINYNFNFQTEFKRVYY